MQKRFGPTEVSVAASERGWFNVPVLSVYSRGASLRAIQHAPYRESRPAAHSSGTDSGIREPRRRCLSADLEDFSDAGDPVDHPGQQSHSDYCPDSQV